MTYRSVLTNLSALSVAGVVRNYDLDVVPDDLSRVQLPALLVLPLDLREDALYKERGKGFQTVAFSGGPRTATLPVTHLLLVAPTQAGRGLRSTLPSLITLIDAYFAALGADVTLGGALLQPAQVVVEAGIFPYGHANYYGCAFRHTWVMQV
jgi:hypothetical protein